MERMPDSLWNVCGRTLVVANRRGETVSLDKLQFELNPTNPVDGPARITKVGEGIAVPTQEELDSVTDAEAHHAMVDAWLNDVLDGDAPLPDILLGKVLGALLAVAFPLKDPVDSLRDLVGDQCHPAIVSGRDRTRVLPPRPSTPRP